MIERRFVLVLAECLCVFYKEGRWSISLSVYSVAGLMWLHYLQLGSRGLPVAPVIIVNL